MTPLLLVGGGGHCLACIDVIESTGAFVIRGIIDPKVAISSSALEGYPFLGRDDDLQLLLRHGGIALVTVGQLKSPETRSRLYDAVLRAGGACPVVTSPRAYVARTADLGNGTIVMHGAILGPRVSVGVNCIINTSAVVEHNATIGSHTHLSTGTIVNGDAHIGTGTFVGSRATIFQGVHVGPRCVIAAGTTIRSDVPPGTMVLGDWP